VIDDPQDNPRLVPMAPSWTAGLTLDVATRRKVYGELPHFGVIWRGNGRYEV
jgi:hypothetical protein